MVTAGQVTFEDVVIEMRAQDEFRALMHDCYLDEDLVEDGRRFLASGEFAELVARLAPRLYQATVLDLGSGNGIAAYAFAHTGASLVISVEPDPSDHVGSGAVARMTQGLPVRVVSAAAEALPIEDSSVDVVYARQVLHHLRDLDAALSEIARVLRPGGIFVASREHVVAGPEALASFLADHPVHQRIGSEGAYTRLEYEGAIARARFRLLESLGPVDCVMNAFPGCRSQQELLGFPAQELRSRGRLGRLEAMLPFMCALTRARVRRAEQARPGALWTFISQKCE